MSARGAVDEMSPSDEGDQSLAELFHLVRSLVPMDQRVFTGSPDMTVVEAIQIMHQHNFSQLPIIAGDTVLGVFSFRSLASGLLKMEGSTEHLGDLPVDEFVEQFRFVQPSDNWESTLEYLDSDDGVLVGRRDRLEAIVTPMDVLTYLREIANPFVMLAEIELSLRKIIQACVAEDQLQQCIEVSLASKYGEGQAPTKLSDMTFNDYVQIIDHGRNWSHFTVAFGKGMGQRKRTAARLREVRVLRNEIFHFRQQLGPDALQDLTAHRDWLQMKAVAFDARRRRKAAAPKVVEKAEAPTTEAPNRKKWDEPSFFEALEKRRGSKEAAAARKLFEWANRRGLFFRWGRGVKTGSCIAAFGEEHGPTTLVLWTSGIAKIPLAWIAKLSPYDQEDYRQRLLDRLNAVKKIHIPAAGATTDKGVPLSVFADEDNLEQFISTMDWVVDEIERASAGGPGELVPPEVADTLDQAAAARLQRFLDSVQQIGYASEERSTLDVYKATFLYRYPAWKEHRPHPISVFYLTRGDEPTLAFRWDMLAKVQDLDIEQLETKLLETGCRRLPKTTTPITLFLKEHNDQATFDRLVEILTDLMAKHRVT